jgi:N-acetylmuramoyl-L-alanine amidase
VRGAPLAVRVQYPAENQVIASRDSNFILGAVGSGDAALTINGIPVAVAPNGAFIGWVPNPPGATPSYLLQAVRGADTARRTLRIRYPARRTLPASGTLAVDSGSLSPGARTRAMPDEFLRVTLRAPYNAAVVLQTADGVRRTMPPLPRTPVAATGASDDAGILFATDAPARLLGVGARVIAARGSDTVSLPLAAVDALDPGVRSLAALRTASTVGSDTDRTVHARTIPDGTYKWLLFPGTTLEVTGRQGGFTRVRLDGTLEVWVDSNDLTALPDGSARPRRVTAGLRVLPAAEWVDLVVNTGERPAFLVEPDGRSIVLTLYGVQANPEISPIIGNDTLVRRISWDQVTSDRVRITLTLSQPVFGWLSLWDDARRSFVLRVRRAPAIDPAQPLRGLTIAVDPGHPPAGSTGPTGLYEGDAVLPVGVLLADMLRARGANVVLTRTTRDPLGLTERSVAARRGNAHAFVSIHLNALPDGVNPFTNNGTSTLFFHQHSEPLARPVQRELMQRLGLRDLGVHYQNLAIARPSWYPAVLAEGAFVIMPEQEAAMRTPEYQRRFAEGLLVGLEAYFRELGGR